MAQQKQPKEPAKAIKSISEKKSGRTLAQNLPFILAIGGAIGYVCAFIIMFDKVQLLKNPSYVPSCDLNPIISCGSVMSSKQGSAFGFPNPFIGLGAFPIVMTVGMAVFAGAKFKRWFWLGLEAGTIFGLLFIHWLFFESVYRIHALCPWCIVVWIITITTFWYTTLYNIDQGHIKLGAGRPQTIYSWIRKHHLDILFVWFILIAFFILKHFWYYYGQRL
jgi:uncharacterized membrane protein